MSTRAKLTKEEEAYRAIRWSRICCNCGTEWNSRDADQRRGWSDRIISMCITLLVLGYVLPILLGSDDTPMLAKGVFALLGCCIWLILMVSRSVDRLRRFLRDQIRTCPSCRRREMIDISSPRGQQERAKWAAVVGEAGNTARRGP